MNERRWPLTAASSRAYFKAAWELFASLQARGSWELVLRPLKSKRSLDQNAISHAWYGQLANELREDDAAGWKRYCKLHHGVPMLRAEDDDFREMYDLAVKRLTYEQKLKAMDFWPVTSIMSVAQLSRYLELVKADFEGRGVRLEFPDDARAAA